MDDNQGCALLPIIIACIGFIGLVGPYFMKNWNDYFSPIPGGPCIDDPVDFDDCNSKALKFSYV